MGDIRTRPEVGMFASYSLVPMVSLGTSLRYGSGNDRDGLLADVSLHGTYPLSASMRLSVGVSAALANTWSMHSLFGVNAQQSLNSGYALFSLGSGLRDVSVQVGSMYSLSPSTMLFIGANALMLLADAKGSPLTRERTAAGAFATLAVRL
jgi:outer membrane scaffolding protein for murein synthesis (MipA/OmpV family)